eukprot:TRINITY_DN1910_c0_g1_i2.p1 TRINITY_DN1910_c0_g1~~TRINITY_DN1910_c0_g1_i2.p1  ORF type:complete len:256 (+),score=30.35 TRINITY_DN1910_c0_g1_i2:42-770(+)
MAEDSSASSSEPSASIDRNDAGLSQSILTLVHEKDVDHIRRTQAQMLERLRSSSSKLESFNEESEEKLGQAARQLQEATRVLQRAQTDLHTVFRRIRALHEHFAVHQSAAWQEAKTVSVRREALRALEDEDSVVLMSSPEPDTPTAMVNFSRLVHDSSAIPKTIAEETDDVFGGRSTPKETQEDRTSGMDNDITATNTPYESGSDSETTAVSTNAAHNDRPTIKMKAKSATAPTKLTPKSFD